MDFSTQKPHTSGEHVLQSEATELQESRLETQETSTMLQPSGEAGIRTPDTGLIPYSGLANRRFRPLSHLSQRQPSDRLS